MKTATIVAVTLAAFTSIPLLAQQIGATGNQNAAASAPGTQVSDSAHAGAQANASPRGVETNGTANGTANSSTVVNGPGTHGAAGFGDEAASHESEMTPVSGELQGKLNSKTAKVGDRVVLKTMEKVHTSDGTVIPKGSRLVGHVTQVQAHDKEHSNAQMGIAFDRAELRDGQSFAIHTLLRDASPSPSAMAMSSADSGDSFDAPMGGGGMAGGGQAMGGGRAGGGLLGGTGRAVGGTEGLAGGTLERTAATTSSMGEHAGVGLDRATDTAVHTAGHGDLNLSNGAHMAAAARAVPHATGIPGVRLGGSSSASGMFSASKKNVEFGSGTQMQLGIVADR